MSLTKIKQTRVTEIFIAEEPIANLAVIAISTGGRSIKIAQTANPELLGGVAVGGVLSGQLSRVVTQGIVSGVLTGAIVSAGDRVTSFNSGRIQPLNSITPTGAVAAPKINLISGGGLLGNIVATDGAGLATLSGAGLMSGITGIQAPAFTGTAWNTGKSLGKALDNALSGLGCRVLVAIGG